MEEFKNIKWFLIVLLGLPFVLVISEWIFNQTSSVELKIVFIISYAFAFMLLLFSTLSQAFKEYLKHKIKMVELHEKVMQMEDEWTRKIDQVKITIEKQIKELEDKISKIKPIEKTKLDKLLEYAEKMTGSTEKIYNNKGTMIREKEMEMPPHLVKTIIDVLENSKPQND